MMGLPEDPVRALHETLFQGWEQFKELCQMHEELRTQILRAKFPTQAQADQAKATWLRQRDLLRQMAATLKWGFSTTDVILQDMWEAQVRQWVDGLDEELRELIKHPNR
jgi:hypothetical protein